MCEYSEYEKLIKVINIHDSDERGHETGNINSRSCITSVVQTNLTNFSNESSIKHPLLIILPIKLKR